MFLCVVGDGRGGTDGKWLGSRLSLSLIGSIIFLLLFPIHPTQPLSILRSNNATDDANLYYYRLERQHFA